MASRQANNAVASGRSIFSKNHDYNTYKKRFPCRGEHVRTYIISGPRHTWWQKTKQSLNYSLSSLLLAMLVTCMLSASCEGVDSTCTIRLFLHTVTVRLFEAVKLNGDNITQAIPTAQHYKPMR